MFKPQFQEIWKWGIITTLTIILGVAVNDLVQLPIGLKYFWILSLAISFFISLAIVQIAWILVPKLIKYIETPNPKNLRLYSGSLHGNIFALNFIYSEWRYIFNKVNVFVNVQKLVSPGSDIPDAGINLEWRKQKTREPLEIKRFISYELNFLQVDAKKNKFWIEAENNKQFKFSQGEYGFKIGACTNILGVFKVNNTSLRNIGLKSVGFKSVWQEIYLIVDYKGHDQISLKVADKKDYEKKVWYKQWQENQKDNP